MSQTMIDFGYSKGIHSFTGDVAKENAASCRGMEKIDMAVHNESEFRKTDADIVYQSYVFKIYKE